MLKKNEEVYAKYCNKVMVYNYENLSWSFNDDCIMCFGYFEQQSDLLWQNAFDQWQVAKYAWNSNVVPAQLRQCIFGNQQGFVCILEPDVSRNVGNMQITQLIQVSGVWTFTVINHNLAQDDFILLENVNGITNTGMTSIFKVATVTDYNTFTVVNPTFSGTYTGGGTIARVSQINIISKQWDPYLKNGWGIYLAKIAFAVATTPAASIPE